MIYLKKLLPSYNEAWADQLMIDTKDGMTHALALMGLGFRGNPRKQQIANSMAQYIRENPEYIIHRLDKASLLHLQQLLKAGKGQYIVVKDLKQPGMLQQMLLVMTYDHPQEGTCFCMLDELHDVFASQLSLIESQLSSDFGEEEDFSDDFSEEADFTDDLAGENDFEDDFEEDDLDGEDLSGYFCAIPLMEDIRKLPYTAQAKVCKAFHLFIRKTDWTEDYMIQRFEQSYRHIKFNQLEECVRWVHFCVNDLDNAISQIDYNDPMTFFMLVAKL